MGTTEEVTPVVEYVFQLINRLKSCQELAIEKMEETKIKKKRHGKTHLVEHDIELINDVPIRTKPYRMSARQTDLLQEEIRKMLKYQVIEIGESDYASPMILVETPGRDPRPCIDYRKLNEVIRTQFYPLSNIEHRIETVAAAKYITLLDLTKGYWQIPLTPKAQSRLMAELLQGCEKFALPYLVDVAIFSENWDDHISHIDKVLERIRDARLTIKLAKCKFAQDSVKYLGHVVGLGKRSPAQLKVQTILDFPVPRTKTQKNFSLEEGGVVANVSRKWGEKGLLESRSPTFRIDSSEKDMRRTGLEGPEETETI
ncbi:hypothetical protein TNCV_4985531 [Trichonephila clavipes]|nr:hypothetical protein TNCV_4985531 [Trichonephila clavipes]